MKKLLLFILLPAFLLADSYPVFPMFVESGSMKQMAFNGGGAALTDKTNGVTLNPSTLYGYHKLLGKRFGLNGSYINDKDGRILAGGGGSFALDPKKVIGVDYLLRNSREGDAPHIHRGTLAYSGLIQEDKSGSVLSWGMNVTYLQNSGMYDLYVPNRSAADSTIFVIPDETAVGGYHHAVAADIGFLEFDAVNGISYAVVLENILGYAWDQRDNSVVTVPGDSVDIDDSTRIPVDTVKFSGLELKENNWLKGKYKSLLIGFALRRKIAGGNAILSIPLDVRFWGFMDKHLRDYSALKNRCMVRTGAETNFAGKLALRVGYSWAPKEYWTNENGNPQFRNYHQVSGGFSLTLKVVDLEMAFKKGEFAAGGSVYF